MRVGAGAGTLSGPFVMGVAMAAGSEAGVSRTAGGEAVRAKGRNGNRWTRYKRDLFLAVLSASCNVRAACSAAEMTPSGAYMLRRRDKEFADAWREAMAMGYDALEGALLRHALIALGGEIEGVAGAAELDGASSGAGPEDDLGAVDGDADAMRRGPRTDGDVKAKAKVLPATGLNAQSLPVSDVQLALVLLSRHRLDVDDKPIRSRSRRATSDETDAALTRKLDALARKLKVPV